MRPRSKYAWGSPIKAMALLRPIIRLFVSVYGTIVCSVYELGLMIRDSLLRIKSFLQGRSLIVSRFADEAAPKRIALIATQANIPQSVRNLIALLREANVQILLVANGQLKPQIREALAPSLWTLIERPPYGRDFAAYQCGAAYLRRNNIYPDKLVFANDSMFYDTKRAPEMLRRALDGSSDVIAATESHEPIYHIGSFFFVVSEKVLRSEGWVEYWKKYPPTSARPKVIRYGELGLSVALTKAGFRPDILYPSYVLAKHLRSWSITEIASLLHLLPREFREDLRDRELLDRIKDDALAIPTPHPAASRLMTEPLSNSEIMEKFYQSPSTLAAQKIFLTEAIDRILSKIETRSQVHWGGSLMLKYLDIGIVKKDFVYRGHYGMTDFLQMMEDLAYPDSHEVAHEVLRRGLPVSLHGLNVTLYRRGFI
jgi:hypothetical protein